jgi:hypothetical protein
LEACGGAVKAQARGEQQQRATTAESKRAARFANVITIPPKLFFGKRSLGAPSFDYHEKTAHAQKCSKLSRQNK